MLIGNGTVVEIDRTSVQARSEDTTVTVTRRAKDHGSFEHDLVVEFSDGEGVTWVTCLNHDERRALMLALAYVYRN